MVNNRIEFDTHLEDNTPIRLYVVRPSKKIMDDGDFIYKKVYSEGIRSGMMSAGEAEKILSERKIWADKEEKEFAELVDKINASIDKLNTIEEVEQGKTLADEVDLLRIKLSLLINKRGELANNTANASADEARMQFYVYKCSYTLDAKPFFRDSDDFDVKANTIAAAMCVRHLLYLITNDGKDLRLSWPENEWRFKHGLIDDKLNPVLKE